MHKRLSIQFGLLITTCLALTGWSDAVSAQDSVIQSAGANTEPVSTVVGAGTGFTITIDGGDTAAAAPKAPASVVRRRDMALSQAGFQVTFDGLSAERRLDVLVLNDTPAKPGETLRLRSQLNYPAFVDRAEVRLVQRSQTGQQRVLQIVPIAPNGTASLVVPDVKGLGILHRVYDAQGRFDETALLAVTPAPGAVVLDGETGKAVEQGTTTLARQRIPITGGAVTVSGDSVPRGTRVQTLGEYVLPDPSGRFVMQRILPPGEQPVVVQVTGAGRGTYIERNVTIPSSEWFYTATADLTFGKRFGSPKSPSGETLPSTYQRGRLAGYAKGRTASGWNITASVDTGEDGLKNLLRDFDKKDPQDALLRAAREDAYPTFGDDSRIADGAPTNGKFYLKAERDGNFVVWGTYTATVNGSRYLRNERTLYGLQGVYRSAGQTQRGEPRFSTEAYAASPDRLPGREAFRGTGGSVYFLQRQDIAVGSETLSIQMRHPDTGRVIETRTLTEGRDYDVNYIQGVITLYEPLTGRAGAQTVVTRPGGAFDVHLIVNYEYTPTGVDIDGLSYGGRVEGWLTDELRVGVTGIVEQTDIADQRAVGADLRYQIGENSAVSLEYAETKGPGFGASVSADGGFVIARTGSAGASNQTGRAVSVEVNADFADLGMTTPGNMSAYYQRRGAGFSTLDYETGTDETLWGVAFETDPTQRLKLRLSYDAFEDATSKHLREGQIALSYKSSEHSTWDFGIEHIDKRTPGGGADQTGARTDVALRFTHTPSEALTWYAFGQGTVDRRGGLEKNNRVGAGVSRKFARHWSFDGEISVGTGGTAGEAMITYQSDGYDQSYIGYRLEPGRDFAGVTLNGRDRGTWVFGGKRRVNEDIDVFAENKYDIFGRHRSLTSVYGVEYRVTERLTFSGAYEFGRIGDDSDFARNALSLGLRYKDGDAWSASAKIEYRLDDGTVAGRDRSQRAFFLNAGLRYKIDESQRLLFNLEYSDTETDNSSILSGTYTDVNLGYAYRPIDNDRLNLLFRYRYLYDMFGQEIDGTAKRGSRQESHVISADLAYDLDRKWTVGAKLGGRFTESAPDDSTVLQRNDAWLGVLNARYHLTHKWDLLIEARHLEAAQANLSETGALATVYRHLGNNLKVGLGYNFSSFSDDLTDLTLDDKGVFLNLVAKF